MPTTSIKERLDRDRKELLDLSARNRLISMPRGKSRASRLDIVDEKSDHVFAHLVEDGKAFTFRPIPDTGQHQDQQEEEVTEFSVELYQPDEELDEDGTPSRHQDDKLQTTLTSTNLQRRLLKLYYDARTYEEEQGVNILYLALGFLKWYEREDAQKERFAPLILVPVRLERTSAKSQFRVSWSEEDITTNLSLQEKLRAEFRLTLPEIETENEIVPSAYFEAVRTAVSEQRRWQVLPDEITLSFFSFLKFLMYRDLDVRSWPKESPLETRPLLERVLDEGFTKEPGLISDSEKLDGLLHPANTVHTVDADSSQAIVVEQIRRGTNLVVQGPPGTGKSQTIVNIIATAVRDRKKVLFVAEKMAALEVVRRRLDKLDLGDMCFELHSHKSNKKAVLADLEKTLALGCPNTGSVPEQAERLAKCREKLNRYIEILHTTVERSWVTPYRIIGELIHLDKLGISPADYSVPGCESWSKVDFDERLELVKRAGEIVAAVGQPSKHPWRGVGLAAVLPTDFPRLRARFDAVSNELESLETLVARLAGLMRFRAANTFEDIATLARLARHLVSAPRMDKVAIAENVWKTNRDAVVKTIDEVKSLGQIRKSLVERFNPSAWDTDVTDLRRDLASSGRFPFRIFSNTFRKAKAALVGHLICPIPKSLSDQLALLDRLMEGQKVRDSLEQSPFGATVFGTLWRGADSALDELENVMKWESDGREQGLHPEFRNIFAKMSSQDEVVACLSEIATRYKPARTAVLELFSALQLDWRAVFATSNENSLSPSAIRTKISQWRDDEPGLRAWISFRHIDSALREKGLSEFANALAEARVHSERLSEQFSQAYFVDMMRRLLTRHSELRDFDGILHSKVVQDFKRLDLERITIARDEVALAHFQGIPQSDADIGEMAIIRREIKKKRRHIPIRELVDRASHALQAIKPVFMMSPISIAQFLKPGHIEFDLLVIDEASQVRPIEAFGAMARAKQMVVVGDDKQLPPTSFFDRIAGEDETDDADDEATGNLESVLGLCDAKGMRRRMLEWHYRSRHHSLITVSNHEFYGNRLRVPPSPEDSNGRYGLRFRYLSDGIYDRGNTRTNHREACAVVEAVMQHARDNADWTLGVATFSVSQRDAILNELELRRREHPETEAFFASHPHEPFFVKNLESVQGDERDNIFISVGYGRDGAGYMAMNFGPLSNDGGERRLNVLITRARSRCEVFTSIRSDDIDLGRTKSQGTKALKTFLKYAETGILDVPTSSGLEPDSMFEIEVAEAIKSLGYSVEHQVGVAGFFIDIAVIDPERPGRYLLGVECDGAWCHSSRSARDRDRLRQQVLEDRGWKIHRVWSTDWFHNRETVLRRLQEAIDAATHNAGAALSPPAPSVKATDSLPSKVGRNLASIHTPNTVLVMNYQVATLNHGSFTPIQQVPCTDLAKDVVQVVRIEGPVHCEELARRLSFIYGNRRTGTQIQEAIDRAINLAVEGGKIEIADSFARMPNQRVAKVRDRAELCQLNPSSRKAKYIPSDEYELALKSVIEDHPGTTQDEVFREVAGMLGFSRVGADLRNAMETVLSVLIDSSEVEIRGARHYVSRS